MPPTFHDGANPIRHPLEDDLNADAWDLLTAIRRSRMAKMNAKGQLAEFFLERQFAELKAAGILSAFEWLVDNSDFRVGSGGRTFGVECKNVRSPEKAKKSQAVWWVEVQRTRNSSEGENTRAYATTDFDILAVCLFNRTGRWDFRFIATRHLLRRPEDETLLAVKQILPPNAEGFWHNDIAAALQDAIQ